MTARLPLTLAALSGLAWLAVPIAAGAGRPLVAAALFIGAGLVAFAAVLAGVAWFDTHAERELNRD